MKILAIGDPHGDLEKIKKIPIQGVNLILINGDIRKADFARKRFFENVERKKKGLKELEYTSKDKKKEHLEIHNSTVSVLKYLSKKADTYFILGNVGASTKSDVKKDNKKYNLNLPSTIEEVKKLNNVHLMKNRIKNFDGLKIGFLEYFVDKCWVEEFKPNKYEKAMKKAEKQTAKVKNILEKFGNLDILICHQPPYGILDEVDFPGIPESWKGKHAGSKVILSYIKKYQPKYVFCGHIHEGEGNVKIGKTEVHNLGVAGHKIIEL